MFPFKADGENNENDEEVVRKEKNDNKCLLSKTGF